MTIGYPTSFLTFIGNIFPYYNVLIFPISKKYYTAAYLLVFVKAPDLFKSSLMKYISLYPSKEYPRFCIHYLSH